MTLATHRVLGIIATLVAAVNGCTTVIYVSDHDGGTAAQSDGGGGGSLCQPCETHDDCGGPDDYCLRNSDNGEVFCAVACQGGVCPDGFTCLHVSGTGIEADQCVPISGSCAGLPVPTGGCNPACQGGQVCQNGSCVTPAPYEAELQHCVDVINQYRATNGKAPLSRSSAIEAYAAEGAQYDSAHGSAHGHFMATNGGGVAWAENEIPGWDTSFGNGSVLGVVDEGLQMMWEEGPGGGHHDNMNGSYTEVGCGIFVTGSNEVWVVQDFA